MIFPNFDFRSMVYSPLMHYGRNTIVQKIQKTGKNITKRQNIIRRQKQLQPAPSTVDSTIKTHNRIWFETPDMGLEALVATTKHKKKLHESLVNEVMKKKAHSSGCTTYLDKY